MYTAYQLLLGSATSKLLTAQAKLADLRGELTSIENQITVEIQYMAMHPGDSYHQNLYNNLVIQRNAKNAEIAAKQLEITAITQEAAEYNARLQTLTQNLKFESYFTDAEKRQLRPYFIEEAFTDETFAVFDVDVSKEQDMTHFGGTASVRIIPNVPSDINVLDMSGIDPTNVINKDITQLIGGSAVIMASGLEVIAEIISGTFERNRSDGAVVCTLYLGAGHSTLSGATANVREFMNANICILGTASNSNVTSGVSISSADIYFTRNSNPFESYSVQNELYQYAKKCHEDLAYPQCDFTIKAANLVFAEEFEPFRDQLALGAGVYLKLTDDTVLKPCLLEVHLDFENPENFALVFSNTFKRHDKVTSLKDRLEKSYSTSRNLNLAKYNYGSYEKSGAKTEVERLLQFGLDAATRMVTAGKDQAVIIDGTGITVKHNGYDEATDTYYTDYIRITNGMIAVMDGLNGVNQAKIGIGRFYSEDLAQSFYGVVADNIVGRLLAGQELIIQSTKDENGHMYFTVDARGARLYNGTFDLGRATGETTITLNPDLGILAGWDLSDAIHYNIDGTIAGINTTGHDVVTKISELDEGDYLDSNFWVDLDGEVYLKGSVYAERGVFRGTVYAESGEFCGKFSQKTDIFVGICMHVIKNSYDIS